MGWAVNGVVPKRRVPAWPLEGVESHPIAQFGDTDNRRVIFANEFPES